ncbi:MAG: hypothetical protein ABW194_03945 [Novosphingobium sp.]
MADAAPSLRRLRDALVRLRDERMALTDPRKRALKRLLLRIGEELPGTAPAAALREIDECAGAVDGLLGQGVFAEVVARSDAAVAAVET